MKTWNVTIRKNGKIVKTLRVQAYSRKAAKQTAWFAMDQHSKYNANELTYAASTL